MIFRQIIYEAGTHDLSTFLHVCYTFMCFTLMFKNFIKNKVLDPTSKKPPGVRKSYLKNIYQKYIYLSNYIKDATTEFAQGTQEALTAERKPSR